MAKAKGAAYGSVGLSVLAVVLLTLGFPLLMGGSVSLAILFGEEVSAKSSPADDNGFQWMEAGDCSQLGGMSNTVSQWDDINWTAKGPASTSTSGSTCWTSSNDAVYSLKIPDQMFNHTDSMSKFSFFYVSSSYCDNCNQNWVYSFNLTINGTTIFNGDDSNDLQYKLTNSHDYWNISFSHRIDGIELMKIRDEIGDCDPNCDIRLNFFDISKGEISGYDYTSQPFQQGQMRIDTFTTDADTEGLIMTLSPYIITVLTLFIAVGSTELWEPLRGWYK